MRRPSASVFVTSTVLPVTPRNTSPGRIAVADTALSVAATYARTSVSGARSATAFIAPSTAAAPPMSPFMVAMPCIVLRV